MVTSVDCQKVSKGPGPGLEPQSPCDSYIAIARRLLKAQVHISFLKPFKEPSVQISDKNCYFTAKLQ